MARVSRARYIPFRVADVDGVAVVGLQTSDIVQLLLRDGAPCSDVVTIADLSGGLYMASYTPLAAGQDFLELSSVTYDFRIQDNEMVDSTDTFFDLSSTIKLTQDTGGVGVLKADVTSPETFTLYVFDSQVWQSGQTSGFSALATTALDSSGNWVTPSLSVLSGTYHIVIRNGSTETHILKSFLKV